MDDETVITTETLAELYLKGENIEKAYRIYQQLLRQNPTSMKFKEKARELELRLRKSRGVPIEGGESPKQARDIDRAIGELKEWLNRIQKAKKRSM